MDWKPKNMGYGMVIPPSNETFSCISTVCRSHGGPAGLAFRWPGSPGIFQKKTDEKMGSVPSLPLKENGVHLILSV